MSLTIPFVGRKAEMEVLEGAVSNIINRRGQTVFISGEAGIGKTTLVEKVVSAFEGPKMAKGWCLPGSSAPLLPFQEALTHLEMADSLKWSAPPKLESVFLVTKDGVPVARHEREETGLDPDIFSSMLSAVSSFVDDSMALYEGANAGGSLSGLEYGSCKVVIESAPNLSIVALCRGREDELMRGDLRMLLNGFEDEYSSNIEDWDGDLSLFEPAQKAVMELMESGRYDGVDHIQADPAMKRAKVFESVLEGLKRRSLQHPVVIFLDDLQWADESSLSLIHYISRNIQDSRILVLGTFRPEEADETSQLRNIMKLMNREGILREIRLPRLDRESSEELIHALSTDSGMTEINIEPVFQKTGGNPFFIVETLNYMAEFHTSELPPKIMDVVMRKMDGLEPLDREFIEVASVYGYEFDPKIVSDILEIRRIEAIRMQRRLQESKGILVAFNDKLSFDHRGYREAVYSALPESTRKDYHLI
ncbi:MAG TPA: hypothetical protein ENN76_00535, partial [Euryarchaeota archaeon]|nr:hypothetical protein [Euryarchaeota archaeon]